MNSPRRNVRRLAGQIFAIGFVLLCFTAPSTYLPDPDPTPPTTTTAHDDSPHETTGAITIITRR